MDLNLNDILSDQPKETDLPKWKKYSIIAGVTAAFIILLIIIIIAIATSSSSGGSDNVKRDSIGQIICEYEIMDTSNPTKILGDEFPNDGNVGITLNKTQVKFTKEYKFENSGNFKIIYEVYAPINMDYMFKDVKTLINVMIYSNLEAKITSMSSTFENCENLKDVTFSGFDTSEIKSVKNLFYNSPFNMNHSNKFNN